MGGVDIIVSPVFGCGKKSNIFLIYKNKKKRYETPKNIRANKRRVRYCY